MLLGALALTGCGFTPAYAPRGQARALLGQVWIEAPQDRDSYILTRELEDRLGRASEAAARYVLRYSLETSQERMAILADNTTARLNVVGKAVFSLRDGRSDAMLLDGTSQSFTGYSATGTPVATRAAERDARQRLMVILADQIVTRLLAGAASLPS